VAVSRRETVAPPPSLRSRAARLAGPLENSPKFYSAFWDFGLGAFFNLTFGTDSSLTASAGWDNVTGMRTPDGLHPRGCQIAIPPCRSFNLLLVLEVTWVAYQFFGSYVSVPKWDGDFMR
jgi:hypothetical protein